MTIASGDCAGLRKDESMADMEKVIKGLECCKDPMISGVKCNICPYWDDKNPDEYQTSCNDNLCADALELLKEQEALLNKACETIADMDFENFCDDLMCDDGWCDENCKTSGTQPKCIERWLRKQVKMPD